MSVPEPNQTTSSLRRLLLFGFAALVVISVGVGLFGYYTFETYPDRRILAPDQERDVSIPPGTSWPEIVERLARADVIDNTFYFRYWGQYRGLPRAVKAGNYAIEGPVTPRQLEALLKKGTDPPQVEVTFPEGFTIFDIADKVEKVGLADRESFLQAAKDPELLDWAQIPGESFEGYLFPDTYQFDEDATAETIVRRAYRHWKTVWEKLSSKHSETLSRLKDEFDFTRHDLIILASLIQKESAVPQERPIIARVFLNRLERDMKLQTDPTCVYGPDTYSKTPTPELCKTPPNEYSTYLHKGLPPGPIANPGRVSLRAALEPSESEESKKYLYFVSRGNDSRRHYFSKTYREHRRAIDRYLD